MSCTALLPRAARGVLAATLAASLLVACGGGGSADTTAASPTGSAQYALGPITGYGSIIVNGVHFDETGATLVDDDDLPRKRSELKMGVVVQVQAGSADASGTRASARHIRFGSELLGPVHSVAADGLSFVLLDQTVLATDTTVLDSGITGGVASLAGRLVEVHAQYDAATGRYTATRIEREASAAAYRLRGTVSNLTATTFNIGAALIDYSGVPAAERPANLADGSTVRVRLQPGSATTGPWAALSVRSGKRVADDHASARLRGTVTAYTSATAFSLDGIVVDASTATFPDGQAFALGSRLKVLGSLAGGVLTATVVEIDQRHADDDDRHPELNGQVTALDLVAKTFKLVGRDETIDYSAARFKNGSAASLAEGVAVQVKGRLGAGGQTVQARTVELKS